MAIDTALKRLSVIGVITPFARVLPLPAGSVDTQDRAIVGYDYAGFFSPPPVVAGGNDRLHLGAEVVLGSGKNLGGM